MSKIGLCTISELSVEKFDSSHTELKYLRTNEDIAGLIYR